MAPAAFSARRSWFALSLDALVPLAFGAAVTVAIAWYAAAREQWAETSTELISPPPNAWPVEVPKSWVRPISANISQRWGASVTHLGWSTSSYDMNTGTVIAGEKGALNHHTAGWPLPSLEGWMFRGAALPGDRLSFLWRIPWGAKGVVNLPLRPTWPGFAINTLACAVIAWSLWQVPVHIRRRWRSRRHRCMRCGYSLAGLASGAGCPECGPPLALN